MRAPDITEFQRRVGANTLNSVGAQERIGKGPSEVIDLTREVIARVYQCVPA